MDLLSPDPEFVLHDPFWPIRTNARHLPPVKTLSGPGEGLPGQARDSLVAAGTIIHGGTVRRSVLGYNVRVREGALVEGSILLDDVDVGPGASLKGVIIDKRVRVPAGTRIGHDPEADARLFTVTSSGIVVVPKEMEI
jgi:glucose-1-phosphate adenylyltransferase